MDAKKNIKMGILGKRDFDINYNFLKFNAKNDGMMFLNKNFSMNNSFKKNDINQFPNIQKLNHSIQNKIPYDYKPQILKGNLRKVKSELKFQKISLKKEKIIGKKNYLLFHNNINSHLDNSYINEEKKKKKSINNRKKGNIELNKDMIKLYNKRTKRENLNIFELNFYKSLERKFLENEYERIIKKLKEKRKKENEERIKKEKTKKIIKLIQIKKESNINNNALSNLIIRNTPKKNNILFLNDQETQTYPYEFFNLDFN